MTEPAERQERDERTLGDEASFFFGQTNPRVIAPLLVAALGLRVAVADPSWWDAVVVLGLIAIQPFTEWLIHVYVLHMKPLKLFGRTLDPLLARKHREHHGDPREVGWIFVPLPSLLWTMPVVGALLLLAFPTFALGMTAVVTSLAILLTYEWIHYLIHSRYKPRSRLYRYVWRAHRLHHFRNEEYWFGVTNPLADHVLGTFPEKEEVERSETCRTLGVDAT